MRHVTVGEDELLEKALKRFNACGERGHRRGGSARYFEKPRRCATRKPGSRAQALEEAAQGSQLSEILFHTAPRPRSGDILLVTGSTKAAIFSF